MSWQNPPPARLAAILDSAGTVAVVGLSPRPERPSHRIARALQGFGYTIIPVRPAVGAVLGEPAYASLRDLPSRPDVVNVFRAAEHLDAVVDDCLLLLPPVLWVQTGIVNEAAAGRARAAGIEVVMDRCIHQDYLSLRARGPAARPPGG